MLEQERDYDEVNDCRVLMPQLHQRFLQFKNFKNKLRDPYIIRVIVGSPGRAKRENQPPSSDARAVFSGVLFQVHEALKPLVMSAENEAAFQSATACHICSKPFLPGDIKVRDHAHLEDEGFRGATHQACNLNYQDAKMIPVVFHNGSCYDTHFLIRALATEFRGNMSVIPNNQEKNISMSKYVDYCDISFRFIDTVSWQHHSTNCRHI